MIAKKIKKITLVFALFIGIFAFAGFVLAQCPNITTVSGTNVTFVGELTDTGGDTTTVVWFEYGKTVSHEQNTSQQTLSAPGLYCITISGLSPCTTYYYRAAATNSAGTSYGERKTFTTSCEETSDFTINKLVRNLSDGTAFLKSVYAKPSEVLVFSIRVKAGNKSLYNAVVRDSLPSKIIYRGDLRIDNVLTSGNIINGLNIGNLTAGQEKTVTFRADVLGPENFNFGQTELINTAFVSSSKTAFSDTIKVLVRKEAVAGAATDVSTGLTNSIFLNSFFLPLAISFLIVWLFRAGIINFEGWKDARKKQCREYKSNKTLQLKIAKIKAKEFLRKKI